MNVFFGLDQLPKFHHAVVTIGTFDGVHLGHQVILESLKQRAASIQGETVIITFEPHPRFVISPNQQAISLLNTLDEKLKICGLQVLTM
ncbi:MAG: adenylyltransferase/cytidyltransferase family protein [Bacteroidetes bacterium]|nr:adenylyltransferase/cytidyltransferase family protein [Bacteroidota bacterium]